MKMKKLKSLCWVWMCAMFVFLVACDGEDGDKNIIFSDSKDKKQTIAASETGSEVTFVALADWQASVVNGASTRDAATTKWITINPDHGAAGTHTINITLLPNYTESDRSATIKVVCGGETVSISVTQEKKKDGELVEPTPTVRWLVDKIEYTEYYITPSNTVINFAYDQDGRVAHIEEKFEDGEMNSFTYTYVGQEIKEQIKYTESYYGEYNEVNGKIGYVLDSRGRVVSWVSEFPGDSKGETDIDNGVLEYSADGYLKRFVTTYGYNSSDWVSVFVWENDNLIRVDNDGDVSTMEYGTQLNNLEINLDLNWAFLGTEWLDNAVFDGEERFKLFAPLGKRSKYYMTKEQGHSYNNKGYYARSYEFDELNRPSKITVMYVAEDGSKEPATVATISYTQNR